MPIVLKSGSLTFLEPSGLVQVCNRISFCFTIRYDILLYHVTPCIFVRVCGGAFGWVRFPMESLEIFIYLTLPAALWPWGVDFDFKRNEYQGYLLRVKAAGAWG